MVIIPFKREHLHHLVIQEQQRGLEAFMTNDVMVMLENERSFSAVDGEEVVACAGVVQVNHGRGLAWAYLADNIGSRLIRVTKAAKQYMQMIDLHRIEMHVDCDFPQAHRWAKMLGFELECERMRAFTPDKRDCALYAMVK